MPMFVGMTLLLCVIFSVVMYLFCYRNNGWDDLFVLFK